MGAVGLCGGRTCGGNEGGPIIPGRCRGRTGLGDGIEERHLLLGGEGQ